MTGGFRLAAMALAAAAMLPGAAVAQFSDSFNFLKAVKDRDGAKATTFIQKPGSVIIDTRDSATGEAALHIVVKRRDTLWLGFLLGKGAKPDPRDAGGNTPLMLATRIGWTDGMSLLIERHAGVDIANSSGATPLTAAVQNRDIDAVRALLAAGANPNRSDTAGLSARDYAKRDQRSSAILAVIDQARPRPKAAVGPN